MALLRTFIGAIEPPMTDLDAMSCWPVLLWAFAAMMRPPWLKFERGAITARASHDCGGFIPGNVAQVREAVHDVHAVLHLATRIPLRMAGTLPLHGT
jgi:hypothetical protein